MIFFPDTIVQHSRDYPYPLDVQIMKRTVALVFVLYVISLVSASEDDAEIRAELVIFEAFFKCKTVTKIDSFQQRLLKENASPVKLLMQLAEKIVSEFIQKFSFILFHFFFYPIVRAVH